MNFALSVLVSFLFSFRPSFSPLFLFILLVLFRNRKDEMTVPKSLFPFTTKSAPGMKWLFGHTLKITSTWLDKPFAFHRNHLSRFG